jgi:DNA-binding IscR family transcriptional regulator
VHGELFDSSALSDPQTPPELREAWRRVRQAVNQTADSITFQELLEQGVDKGKMYYI